MNSKETLCVHEKVYADFCYPTNPPQYPWICKKCGEKGIEREQRGIMFNEYDQIKKKFSKED